MPFRSTFDCLWCGSRWTTRTEDDVEGWAQLCPDCVGKAGDNEFLRFRLREAIAARGAAKRPSTASADGAADAATPHDRRQPAVTAATNRDVDAEMRAYYDARAPEYDDWYLRRGRYERGPVHDAAWNAELDAAGRWLDRLPIRGEILELAAGTGWWSPLLAEKGSLTLHDTSPAALDRARDRLLAHGLRAHLHVQDAWAEPDRELDAVFAGFWLSHVPDDRLGRFLELAMRWLRPGGTFAFIDSLPDPHSGAIDHPPPSPDGTAMRRLADEREFRIVKVIRPAPVLAAALQSAGYERIEVGVTGRFFVTGSAARPGS
jgi:demethylmenaquinone methyltransferase/2-methoxy-6-polyprenyl-1,4-benzoquinol methylase